MSWIGQGGGVSSGGVPLGTVIPYVLASEPDGWLFCDGDDVDTGLYPDLERILRESGYPFGSNDVNGDGSVVLAKVPNLNNGVMVVGYNPALASPEGNGNFVIGADGGKHTHSLTVAEMPAHNHDPAKNGLTGYSYDAAGAEHSHNFTGRRSDISGLHFHPHHGEGSAGQENYVASGYTHRGQVNAENINHRHAISPAGSSHAHSRLSPYVALNYIIRAID